MRASASATGEREYAGAASGIAPPDAGVDHAVKQVGDEDGGQERGRRDDGLTHEPRAVGPPGGVEQEAAGGRNRKDEPDEHETAEPLRGEPRAERDHGDHAV